MPLRHIVLIPIAVAINLALSALVDPTGLPLFLDTTGTVLATALAGPVVGVTTGVVTTVTNSLRNPTFLPFVVVQVVVALYAWGAARMSLFRRPATTVPAGFGLGVLAAAISTPISYVVFGCATSGGVTLLTLLGRRLGMSDIGACAFGSFASDFGDKTVTFVLVAAVLHALPRRTAARFPLALRAAGRA